MVNKLETSHTDDARVVIYDRQMFLVQTTGLSFHACICRAVAYATKQPNLNQSLKRGIPECNQNMMSLRGQASWAKMTSLGGQTNSTGVPPSQISKQR